MTPARAAVIIIVALLPAAVGAFHLMVFPLVPFSEQDYLSRHAARPDWTQASQPEFTFREGLMLPSSPATASSRPVSLPETKVQPINVVRARYRIEQTFSVVALGCIVASVAIGVLGVQNVLPHAFLQACLLTMGFMLYDGQGAFMGPIMFTIFFYPIIYLGRGLRLIFIR